MGGSHERLGRISFLRAVNARDIDGLVSHFAPGYVNETPAHPARGFTGREQVRTNWTRMFAGVPDLSAEVLRTAVEDDATWTEWEMRGTKSAGSPHLMRGVVVFGVVDGLAEWARFFLEPVDDGSDGVDAAISSIVEPSA